MKRIFGSALIIAASLGAGPAFSKDKITMWFWGASPAYQQALDDSLIKPFNASQDKYELVIEYRTSVDNDVRTSVMAGQGPDLVYTSGPSDVTPLAKAGKLAPMEDYAKKYGWNERLLGPVLDTCQQVGHLYCLPPSVMADGMYYNKAVLAENGWDVPKNKDDLEKIMKAAQAKGMYGSVTGNSGWQPINENYASIFLNQMVGPKYIYELLTGKGDWSSPEMVAAIKELDRWYKAGYLGGKDYFSLNFDSSLSLLQQKRAPFFFAPSFSYQWAVNYFKDANADDLGFTAFPNMSSTQPYPIYSIGSAFTYSINANSQVKDGAAMVLDMMMSKKFATDIAKVWPGYWSIPLNDFPNDPSATGITKSYYQAMADITAAVKKGQFGYKIVAFFPPATKDVFIQDLESVWMSKETPEEMLQKAGKAFEKEYRRGLVPQVTAATF
jgi:raffinose/stachyose/melibiose transport system substrate-binding protein